MNRIRELRVAHNLTMAELGKRVGCSEASISYYELGKREAKYEILLKLAEALDTSVDYLLGNTNIQSNSDYTDLISHLSGEKLDALFLALISDRDKDYLLQLAAKILEIASKK